MLIVKRHLGLTLAATNAQLRGVATEVHFEIALGCIGAVSVDTAALAPLGAKWNGH